MKYISCVLLALCVVGCSPLAPKVETGYVMPNELSDCKIYRIDDGWTVLYVVRCPDSQTTTGHTDGTFMRYVSSN